MAGLEATILNGRYRIEELVGRGGRAKVYRACDSRRTYHVAINLLRADLAEDLEVERRFTSEADALARLANRCNIIRLYSFERDGRCACIVFDSAEGDTRRGRIFPDASWFGRLSAWAWIAAGPVLAGTVPET